MLEILCEIRMPTVFKGKFIKSHSKILHLMFKKHSTSIDNSINKFLEIVLCIFPILLSFIHIFLQIYNLFVENEIFLLQRQRI